MKSMIRAVFAAIMGCIVCSAGAGLAVAQTSQPSFVAHKPASKVDIHSVPLETLVGQMVMLGFRGTVLKPDSPIQRDIAQGNLGGVIFFDRDIKLPGKPRNIVSPAQTRALIRAMQAEALIPLFVAVDQEGGMVRRLKPETGFMDFPCAAELGKTTPDQTAEYAARLSAELRDLGFTMNFAPVADIAVFPDSPAIGRLNRAFSSDPKTVVAHNRAFLKGLAAHGVIGCLKHFPGHGSARQDTHQGVADITKTWQTAELMPYEQLIRENAVPMIMVGHLYHAGMDSKFPSSLSYQVITKLLRTKLGFEGVIISDDLQMKAIQDYFSLRDIVSLSIQAGTDILLFGNNMEYDPDLLPKIQRIVRELVENGVVSRARLEQSYNRIMRLKSGFMPVQ